MHQFIPTLYISLRSPFARRIRLAFHRLGLPYSEKTLDVFQNNPELQAANPLGMVPTLVTEHGPISDSAHILEYLHETYGGIWPENEIEKFRSRQASVLATGIMQSTVLYYQETQLHEVPSSRWIQDHEETIHSCLNHLSEAPKTLFDQFTQPAWDLCVALEYLDLRVPSFDWRTHHPELLDLLLKARMNEYFCATTPPAT